VISSIEVCAATAALGVVAAGDVQQLGDRGRAAPGELDVAVTDLVRLLGRPATDPRTAGKRALTRAPGACLDHGNPAPRGRSV
jgi:hypothetical protein